MACFGLERRTELLFSRLMNPLWSASLLLASWGLGTYPTVASAQDDPGRIHFQAGASDYESGDYQHALGEFQRAYDLSQRTQLFYNISLCYQQLGDLEHAVEFLGRYLNEVEEIPNRAALERRQENLTQRLEAERAAAAATGTTTTDTTTSDTTTSDTTTSDTTTTDTTTTDTTTTDTTTSDDTTSDTTTSDDTSAGSDIDRPQAHEGGANVPAIASFIGGGVGLAMAVSFGVMALGERNRVSTLDCAETMSCDDVPGANPTKMDTYALLSDVGTGLAVVGVGLGLVFLLTATDDEEDPGQARLRVAPFAGPDTAGLAAQGSF